MTLPITPTVFTPGELTSEATWYARVFKPMSDALVEALGDEDWTDLTLGSGWAANLGAWQTPQYIKRGGIVRLRGLIKDGTYSSSATVFTLPEGYRPDGAAVFDQGCQTGSARMTINTDGTVTADYLLHGAGGGYLTLSGIRFPAAAA